MIAYSNTVSHPVAMMIKTTYTTNVQPLLFIPFACTTMETTWWHKNMTRFAILQCDLITKSEGSLQSYPHIYKCK